MKSVTVTCLIVILILFRIAGPPKFPIKIFISSRYRRSSRARSFSSFSESKRQLDHSTFGQAKLEVSYKKLESTQCVASYDPRHNEAAKKKKYYLRYRSYPYNNYGKQCRSRSQLSGQSAAGKEPAHERATGTKNMQICGGYMG